MDNPSCISIQNLVILLVYPCISIQNNSVLLVKNRFGPAAGIPSIIIDLPVVEGVSEETPLLINQPMGKGHL